MSKNCVGLFFIVLNLLSSPASKTLLSRKLPSLIVQIKTAIEINKLNENAVHMSDSKHKQIQMRSK